MYYNLIKMSTAKKKIIVFITAYWPLVGGAEIATQKITERLAADFDFDLITARLDRKNLPFERRGEVNIYRLGLGLKIDKFLLPILGWLKAWQLNKQKKYDLIWAVQASFGGLAARLFKLWGGGSKRFLLTLQEGKPEGYLRRGRWGLVGFFSGWIIGAADWIQTISNYLASYAKSRGFRGQVIVVPNGVERDLFWAAGEAKKDQERCPIIVTASRLVEKNGVDILIEAMAELKNRGLEARCLIAGDGELKNKLMLLARDLGVGDEVDFLGVVSQEKLAEIYQDANIFVRPARSEGLGSAFLEAMMAGLVTVGTPVGGIIDFLVEGKTGYLTPLNDYLALANKLEKILEDKMTSAAVAERGRLAVRDYYSWDNITAQMKSCFIELTRKKMLIATGIFPPDIGGPATYSNLLLTELPKNGFSVRVLSYGFDNNNLPEEVTLVSRKLSRGWRHLVYFFKCWQLARAAETIYAQNLVTVGWPAMVAAKFLKKRFIVRIVGDWAWEKSCHDLKIKDSIDEFQTKNYGWLVRWRKWLRSYVARRADLVIVPSKYLKNIVLGWGVSQEKIRVIYNAVDIPITRLAMSCNNKDKNLVITAGRLVSWKGFDVVIEVAQELLQEGVDLKLVIAGDGPERVRLESLVKPEFKERVVFRGDLKKDELMTQLAKACVFVLNTGYEGFSHQILEVMHLGVPVVTTNVGGNPELVIGGETGFLVDCNDKEAIKERIKLLLLHPSLKTTLGERGREVASQFSKERMLREISEALK